LVDGAYGLRITFKTGDKEVAIYDLNSSQMLGNIYNSAGIKREVLFNVDQNVFSNSETIELTFYENENFKVTYTEEEQTKVKMLEYNTPAVGGDSHDRPPVGNIKLTKVELYLGYDARNLKDKEFILNSNSNRQYYYKWDDGRNTKEFTHSFIYKDEKGKFHRDKIIISSLWRCMGEDDNNWEIVGGPWRNGQEKPTYFITPSQRVTSSNVIRIKGQLKWEGETIDSNIINFYKYDDGIEPTGGGQPIDITETPVIGEDGDETTLEEVLDKYVPKPTEIAKHIEGSGIDLYDDIYDFELKHELGLIDVNAMSFDAPITTNVTRVIQHPGEGPGTPHPDP